MRIALVGQWLRAARQDPVRRSACLTYALWVTVAQAGWAGGIFLQTSVPVTFAIVVLLIGVETMGPVLAERKNRTPWHAHHIVERYGLLTIIALGEGVVGTVASLSAVVTAQGWTFDAVFVAVAGIGLTFGMWWTYFVSVPQAELLHALLGALVLVRLPAHRDVGRHSGDRRGHARRRVLHRAPFQAELCRDRAVGCPARRGLHRLDLPAVHADVADRRRLPHAARGADRGCAGGSGVAGRSRHFDGQLPAGRHAGADGHGRRL